MQRFLLTLFLFTSLTITGFSQEILPEASTETPYKTIFTHLYYLQPETYEPANASQVIYAPNLSSIEKIEVASKLKKVLDGKGLYVDMTLVPENANYIDSARQKSIYILSQKEPRIYLEKIGEEWLYSTATIQQIDKMYAEVYPWGTDFFDSILPYSVGHKKVLFLYVWQWLAIVILAIAIFVFYWLLKNIAAKIIQLITKIKFVEKNTSKDIIERIAMALSLLVSILLLNKLLPALMLPVKLAQYVVIVFNLLTIIFASILAVRIAAFGMFYLEKIAAKTESKLDDQLLPIVNNIIKAVIAMIGIAYCLAELNVDVKAIFAGLSVGALALALAAQDTVKNLIGSITIFLDHPFEIGDYIIAGGVEGEVEEVGMRATRIRTPKQSLAYIPNGELSNIPIDNLGLRVYRRWRYELGIVYGTPTDKIEEFIKEVNKIIDAHPHSLNEKTQVKLNNLGASSLNILVNVFFNVKTWAEDLDCKQEILLQILKKAEEMKIDFAFPTQTLIIEKDT